jgi:hypothetical protein
MMEQNPVPSQIPNQNPIEEPPKSGGPEGYKYKEALKYSLAVIVLLVVVVAFTLISFRGSSLYKAGYVNGWNDCRAAQIELNAARGIDEPLMPLLNSTQNTTDAQIQIVGVAS